MHGPMDSNGPVYPLRGPGSPTFDGQQQSLMPEVHRCKECGAPEPEFHRKGCLTLRRQLPERMLRAQGRAEGKKRKAKGIKKVLSHADQAWLEVAEYLVKFRIKPGESFTSDRLYELVDVWNLDREADGLPVLADPSEPNIVGAFMHTLHKKGWIEGTDSYIGSNRPEAHGRVIRVWLRV